MTPAPDVVVVGAGGLGASTAYSLTKRGVRVTLIDRREPGSQTSPRAAGMLAHARGSDLMVDLMKAAGARLRSFTEETGQPLDWVRPGSLKLARRHDDAALLDEEHARARRLGLDAALLTAEEAAARHPLLRPDGVVAAHWLGDDLYFDPAQVAIGFARAAQAGGATLLQQTVERVVVAGGRVTGVETDRGRIDAPVVVDAAGAWVAQLADVPVVPTRHQLFITEPLDGVHRDVPLLRIMDAAVYARPCDGGMLWGVFEDGPLQVDVAALGDGFDMADVPLDADVLWRAAADVEPQLPALRHARPRIHRGGLPTMTADGHHVVGPAPGAEGLFVVGGCNVAGLSISPALGDELAAWIVDGAPLHDLTPLLPARFGATPPAGEELARAAAWQYRHFYGSA